ncbi:MAG: EamA family transporter RarD [Treponema sp.]|nr:EamA family transporter RarD [Treponema sp.]
MNKTSFNAGVLYGMIAYILWGILPLYWKLLSVINPFHVLAFRILLSLILVGCILIIKKNYTWLNFLKDKKDGLLVILAALIISFNWGLYIRAVNYGHTIEAAMGYYINPLISVVLGLCVFREKINRLQAVSFALAVTGVLLQIIFTGSPPWISLGLALSFGIYGLIKKTIKLSALESLGSETLAASPVSLILLIGAFGKFPNPEGLMYLKDIPVSTTVILSFCGLITALPLFLFAKCVKILPLSTVGFMQFLAPTLTFLTGVFVFKEAFSYYSLIVFGFIWAAVVLYVISLRHVSK